jgi:type IV secretory pathway TrbD component
MERVYERQRTPSENEAYLETIQQAKREFSAEFDSFHESVKKISAVALTVIACLIAAPIAFSIAGLVSTFFGLVVYLTVPLLGLGIWGTASSIVNAMDKEHRFFEYLTARLLQMNSREVRRVEAAALF